MTLLPYIFADISDSPWVILMVLLGGPLINWLTKRREEAKEQQQQSESKKSGRAEERAAMAELLRQLMGEPPAKAPVPPPLPAWEDEDEDELMVPSNRRTSPPALPSTRGSTVQAINRERELAKQRVKQLREEQPHLAGGDGYSKGRGATKGKHKVSPWRDRKKARQAFVASLIFAPPKGLEMDR